MKLAVKMNRTQKLELTDTVLQLENTIKHYLAQPELIPHYPAIAHIYNDLSNMFQKYCVFGIPMRHYYRGEYLKGLLTDSSKRRISYYIGTNHNIAYYNFTLKPDEDYVYNSTGAVLVKWPHEENYPRGMREIGEIYIDGDISAYSVKLAVEYALRNSLEFWKNECRFIADALISHL